MRAAGDSTARFERLRSLLPAIWLGWMSCVAVLATPSAVALLARADAGRVAGRMLAGEAYSAIALGVLLLVLERVRAKHLSVASASGGSQFSLGVALCLAALFCTVAGYFALLPMMDRARAGAGSFGFGQLHAISAAFFLVKLACVAWLAWRNAAQPATRPPSS